MQPGTMRRLNPDTELVNNIDQNIEFFSRTAVENRLVLTVAAYEMRRINRRTFSETESAAKTVVLKVNGTIKKSCDPHDFVNNKKLEFTMGNDGQLIINVTPRY
jgi:hypothetical protein